MVGVQGFEPWTLWSQTRCATRLRYTPKLGAGRESRTPRSSAWKAAGRPLSCLPALLYNTLRTTTTSKRPGSQVLCIMRYIKVSSYLHHIGPRLSCYSVHVFFHLDGLASRLCDFLSRPYSGPYGRSNAPCSYGLAISHFN